MTLTDHQLKTAIIDELEWAPEVDADHVGVGLTDGAVTLSGEVTSYPEKQAAVAAALRVRGVTAVADALVVRHPWGLREDADIARDAGAVLDRSTSLPPGSVKAEVHDQVVTLTGALPWQYQRLAAVRAVSALRGVADVRNLIALNSNHEVSPAAAEADVVAALQRNERLDARHVVVVVHGSVITLTGDVPSWGARHEAELAAWCTPGVTQVEDRLQIIRSHHVARLPGASTVEGRESA